ncbi:MAG: patatin-like phospholipase family protein [Paracoccaceae bacterium]
MPRLPPALRRGAARPPRRGTRRTAPPAGQRPDAAPAPDAPGKGADAPAGRRPVPDALASGLWPPEADRAPGDDPDSPAVRAPATPHRRAVLAGLGAGLAGCASAPERAAYTLAPGQTVEVPGFPGVRFWADAPFEAWSDHLGGAMAASPHILAISGGAENGAFGAGLLGGWSETGTRPDFDVVTGLSTGAFIAPFAFLGASQDATLKAIYTGFGAGDLIENRGLRGLLGAALYDTAPMRRVMDRFVTDDLLDRIASAHADGRRLFVITTQLDAQRAVVWNMGRIAASTDPARRTLFRDVLLASAAVPGVFPSVTIEAEAAGRAIEEMHVDGGTVMQVLALPEALLRRLPRGFEGAGSARSGCS